MKHVLDQPVWNALTSGNSGLSYGLADARYFDIDVAPFADVVNQHSDQIKSLYRIIPAGRGVAIFSTDVDLHAGPFTKADRIDGYQMVYEGPLVTSAADGLIHPLDENNVEAMLSLTALTAPGPFSRKTIDFGHYYGIFQQGTLVAMAGQRLHPGNYAEISAVCTHPDFTGKGFARKLIMQQIAQIQKSGQIPFLHVKNENFNAVKLYQSIGFKIRTEISIHILKK